MVECRLRNRVRPYSLVLGPYAEAKWLLHTSDAHELYRKFSFGAPGVKVMERSPV
jgi:hypothetical protein